MGDTEIRVSAVGSVSAYISRAATVFNELGKPFITITGSGNAVTKAVTVAEVVKRRFKGLHQVNSLSTQEVVDEYEPLEEGLDKVTETRTMSILQIKLSKDALDTADLGYQAPIPESEVKELDMEALQKPRGRGKGEGRGRSKGKGKGKSNGKGKGSGKSPKGKGKGKGKSRGKS